MIRRTLGLVCCGAGGTLEVREHLVGPLIEAGWTVAITATPTAAHWLANAGELTALESLTGLPVRSSPRLPAEDRTHPTVDLYAVVPASANTVAKLALGVADNQALATVCEAIGAVTVPVVVFPRINAAHANHPAWGKHTAALTSAGVELIQGEDVWPLHPPRSEPDRPLPWAKIIDRICMAAGDVKQP